MAWADPAAHLLCVILTNRPYSVDDGLCASYPIQSRPLCSSQCVDGARPAPIGGERVSLRPSAHRPAAGSSSEAGRVLSDRWRTRLNDGLERDLAVFTTRLARRDAIPFIIACAPIPYSSNLLRSLQPYATSLKDLPPRSIRCSAIICPPRAS